MSSTGLGDPHERSRTSPAWSCRRRPRNRPAAGQGAVGHPEAGVGTVPDGPDPLAGPDPRQQVGRPGRGVAARRAHRTSAPTRYGGKPLLPAAVGADLLIRGSPPVTGTDELDGQGPTAGADRPAVAHPPAAGRHHRRGDRQAAVLPGDRAGGGKQGRIARGPPSRSSRPSWPAMPGRSGSHRGSPARWSESSAARTHQCPVGRQPRRRVSAIRLLTRPGRPAPARGWPGRTVRQLYERRSHPWKLKNASRC
jgi:hypothetical protein